MILDCVLWIGLVTAVVVFILLGCRLVIDFPGLLEGNVVHAFKQVSVDQEALKEEKEKEMRELNLKMSSHTSKPAEGSCMSQTVSQRTDEKFRVTKMRKSRQDIGETPPFGKRAKVEVTNGEVSIVIKNVNPNKDFSINICIDGEDSKTPTDDVVVPLVDKPMTVADPDLRLHCDLYQTNKTTNRNC